MPTSGWLFDHQQRGARERFAPDLIADPVVSFVDRTFIFWSLLGLAIPFGLGWLIGGSTAAALEALLWAGVVRVMVLHHVTYSINSLCHFFGRRRFQTADYSRNLFWLAPFSMGEAWHNNHHAFPDLGDPRHGPRRAGPLGPCDPRAGARRAGLGRAAGRAPSARPPRRSRPELRRRSRACDHWAHGRSRADACLHELEPPAACARAGCRRSPRGSRSGEYARSLERRLAAAGGGRCWPRSGRSAGRGYLWPAWAWLGLGVLVLLDCTAGWAWRRPPGARAPGRMRVGGSSASPP